MGAFQLQIKDPCKKSFLCKKIKNLFNYFQQYNSHLFEYLYINTIKLKQIILTDIHQEHIIG